MIEKRLRKQHNELAQLGTIDILGVASKQIEMMFTVLRGRVGEKHFPNTQSFVVTMKRSITTQTYEKQREASRKWRATQQRVQSKKILIEQDGDSNDDAPTPARAAPPPAPTVPRTAMPAVPVPTTVKPTASRPPATVSPPNGGFGSRLASAFAGVLNKVASVVEEPSPTPIRRRSSSVQSDQHPSPSSPVTKRSVDEQRKQHNAR